MNKKISVITVTYNTLTTKSKELFYEMFRSVHEQDYPNIEHVIIDGASTDGSVEFIQNIINKYAKKEVKFISEKDKGINDATNKGFINSTGDYVIIMCDDDYYTQKDSISNLVETLENNNADYCVANCWWLDKTIFKANLECFAYNVPFVINTGLFNRKIIEKEEFFLNPQKYPIAGDWDFQFRIMSKDNIKGVICDKVLTVLRPCGFSHSSAYSDALKEFGSIFKNAYCCKQLSEKELINIHLGKVCILTVLKIMLFCKNKNIKTSVLKKYNLKYMKKAFIRKLEYILFLKFITNKFRRKNIDCHRDQNVYTLKNAREWVETFYEDLYK